MQRGTSETGSAGAEEHRPRHSLWARLRLGVGRALRGGAARPSDPETLLNNRAAAGDVDALLRSHAAHTARLRALELEISELRAVQTARVIPQEAADSLQNACATLAGAVPDELLIGTVLSDFNRAVATNRIALILNAQMWTDTVLENVRTIPAAPRLIDERSINHLLTRPVLHQAELPAGATIAVPITRHDETYALVIAEIDGSGTRFAPWQLQLVQTFAAALGAALVSSAIHQRGTRQALLEQRTAVASKLHDPLLQSISFARLQLGRLQSLASRMGSWGSDELNHVVNEVRDGMDLSIAQVRELLAQLRAPAPRDTTERERR